MADIRINALATTAASTASDDFLAVDGSSQGTRKLNAYSPTFGGNVVATGTLTVNSTTDSSSKDTGAIVTEGGLGVEKSATIGGNLTVSGTGTSSFNGPVTASTSSTTTYLFDAINTNSAGYSLIRFENTGASGRSFDVGLGGATSGQAGLFYIYDNTANATRLAIPSGGNLLVGTTTDSGNGKVQLAAHSTSAGGVGYGVDVAMYNTGTGTGILAIKHTNWITPGLKFIDQSDNTNLHVGSSGSTGFMNAGLGSLLLQTGGTTALTLDSSQNATFAGNAGTNAAFRTLAASSFPSAVSTNGHSYYFGSSAGGAVIYGKGSVSDVTLANKDGSDVITIPAGTTDAKITGSIAIGNTVQTAVAVASTHKVTISIGGSTYYLLATNV